MTLVEAQLQMFLGWQKDDTPEDFLKLFKARADVINAHGGGAGFHSIYEEHLVRLKTSSGISDLENHPDKQVVEKLKQKKILKDHVKNLTLVYFCNVLIIEGIKD